MWLVKSGANFPSQTHVRRRLEQGVSNVALKNYHVLNQASDSAINSFPLFLVGGLNHQLSVQIRLLAGYIRIHSRGVRA